MLYRTVEVGVRQSRNSGVKIQRLALVSTTRVANNTPNITSFFAMAETSDALALLCKKC